MMEVMLRFVAVLFASVIMIVFGWYFAFTVDSLQHDWIYFGGAVLVLLGGLGTLGSVVMLGMQVREWGPNGLASDVGDSNTIEVPTPPRAAPAAAAATASASAGDSESDGEGDSEE
jgi:ABC-type uncharacterized transport system permease subunit